MARLLPRLRMVFVAGMGAGYLVAAAYCASSSAVANHSIGRWVWLLGPPASLIWGNHVPWMWAFVLETVIVLSMWMRVIRTKERKQRFAFGAMTLLFWVLSGIMPVVATSPTS